VDGNFVDLGVSFFDEDFTLDPFPYIEDLYGREDVLGCRADGMNFVFRFADALQVIRDPCCVREPLDIAQVAAREQEYAAVYPQRARMNANVYTMAPDGHDFVTKKLMMDYLDRVAREADFSGARPLYERLGIKGQEDEYVESMQTLPLRVVLTTCGLAFTERELLELQKAGMDYVKAFDNVFDESILKASDEAVARVSDYLDARLPEVEPDSRIEQLLAAGRRRGLSEERLRMNIAGILIISLANTLGISSAYVLRTLVRNPETRRMLRRNPALLEEDRVMTELLRRDNHVKALSRVAHEETEVGRFRLRKGESVFLFFPGVSLDPAMYPAPLALDLDRRFSAKNQLVFGGSAYICIGKQLGLEFVKQMAAGFVEHLPEDVYVEEDRVEADGSWVTERIITKLPIEWDS
jgi:cytochrome P450